MVSIDLFSFSVKLARSEHLLGAQSLYCLSPHYLDFLAFAVYLFETGNDALQQRIQCLDPFS